METKPSTSLAILQASYDAATQVLEIEWSSRRSYRYFDVPQGVYDWYLRAKSKGRFINRLVRDRYRYEEIHTKDEGEQDLAAALAASLGPNATERDG